MVEGVKLNGMDVVFVGCGFNLWWGMKGLEKVGKIGLEGVWKGGV